MPVTDWNALMQEGGGSFEPLPEGQYDVEVGSAEHKPSSTGKDMWVVVFRVLVGPHAGRTVYNNFTLSPGNANALRFFFTHMNVLGLGQQFFAANPSPDQVANALVGKRCSIKVKQRLYNGAMVNDVKAILASGVTSAPPAPGTVPPPPPAPQQAPPQPQAPVPPAPPVPPPPPVPQAPAPVPVPVAEAPAPPPVPVPEAPPVPAQDVPPPPF